MTQALVAVTPTTLSPVARTCRDVITHAVHVTELLIGAADPGAPCYVDPLATLEATNPALADALRPLLDAVMELDGRTGLLGVA